MPKNIKELIDSFNSSMVRLVDQWDVSTVRVFEFQFQYGAIGSYFSNPVFEDIPVFQFQYGAIGSEIVVTYNHNNVRFNSSMVRLVGHAEYR